MMRTFVLSILLLLFAASLLPLTAQEVDEAKSVRQKAMAKIMPRSIGLSVFIFGNGWTLNSNFIENGDEPDFQQFVGTTDAQYQAFSDYMLGTRAAYQEKMQPIFSQLADETDPDKIAELADAVQTTILGLIEQAEVKAAEILTPAQIAKFREFDLHMNQQMEMTGLPFFNYEAYQALNLTAEQQKQLHEIRDGFRKEQLAQIDEFSKLMPKPGEKPDPKAMAQLGKKQQELSEKGKQLYARMKAKTQSILTKEQTAKLDELLKKTPECMTSMLQRRTIPPPKIDEKKYEDWQKSWKPGDPIPAEYRRHEKARRRPFP